MADDNLKIDPEEKSIKLSDLLEYMKAVEKIFPEEQRDYKLLWCGLKQGLKSHNR